MKDQELDKTASTRSKEQAYRPIEQLLPAQWLQTSVVANGIHQHYIRTGGDKPPLLLLHGFMESGVSWLRVARELAATYDVVMPDARVHGRSNGAETGFTPEILSEDAAALIQTLQLQRPVLIGRSNGAVTAFLVAAHHPALVQAVVMEDPPAGGVPAPAVRQQISSGGNWFEEWMTWMQQLKKMPHAERIASAAARWPHGMPIPPDEPLWDEDDFVTYVESLANFDTGIFQQKIGFWTLRPYIDLAAQSESPMLLLTGEPLLGSLVPEDVVLALLDCCPQLHWQQVDGGGHILSRGRPFTPYMTALHDFLQTV